MLSREMILNALDLKPTPLEVPEWGGTVFVRAMSLGDMLAIRPLIQSDRDITAELVVRCACDDKGNALFGEADIPALQAKCNAALQRIALAAIAVNKLGKPDADTLEKN